MNVQSEEYQYVSGQHRPTFEALFADYEAMNAEALSSQEWLLDLSYGPHPRQTLDLCLAAGKPRGTLLYLHAGYWQSRDKAQFRFIAPVLSELGFNVALANYPLCPDVQLAEIAPAVGQAIPFLMAELPPEQRQLPLVVAGHSAGGHLAVELALAQRAGDSSWPIQAILPISGVFDLMPLLKTTLNSKLKLDARQAQANSPLRRMQPGLPAARFVVGGEETSAFLEQSMLIADAWSTAGNESCYVALPEQDHFSVLQSFRDPQGEIIKILEELFARPSR